MIHVRIPISSLERLEKLARVRAGARSVPRGAVSKLVREAIEAALVKADADALRAAIVDYTDNLAAA